MESIVYETFCTKAQNLETFTGYYENTKCNTTVENYFGIFFWQIFELFIDVWISEKLKFSKVDE